MLIVLTFVVGLLVGVAITAKAFTCQARPEADPSLNFKKTNYPKWCLPVEINFDGRLQTGMACSESKLLCYQVEETAKKLGGLGGIKTVGTCNHYPQLQWKTKP